MVVLNCLQMKWTEVVQDCSQAVQLNPRYIKALFRRAKALEKLDNKKECLEGETLFLSFLNKFDSTGPLILLIFVVVFVFLSDVTAVCILEAFQNQQSMLLADKVLKQLGKEKAKDKYKVGPRTNIVIFRGFYHYKQCVMLHVQVCL